MKSGITLTDYDIIIKNPIGADQIMIYENWVGGFESEENRIKREKLNQRIKLNKKIKKVKNA